VNRSGLEYCAPPDSLANAGITQAEFATIVTGWGANIIRLPFNQQWALHEPDYITALDWCVEAAANLGAYTLLDLQWLDATTVRGHTADGKPNFVPPLPNLESVELWRQLARRYRDQPAVLYDLFNEPHDPLPDDSLASGRVTMAEWQPWAIRLIEAIRSEHPSALIFVSGVDWAYDLEGFPLPDSSNIVYSTHIYPNKGNDWDRAFGGLAATYPVFAGEWGGEDQDVEWGRRLAGYLETRGIGWTAWSWKDWPQLILPPGEPPYEPTAFGALVRGLLGNQPD
jgi:hypothetical protein